MANDQSVGAIWVKKKGDNVFLSIKINDTNYVAFKNKYKEKENQPDYNILKAQRQETAQDESPKDPIEEANSQSQQIAEEENEV